MGQTRYAKKLIAALHHKRPEKRREVAWVLGQKREGKAVGPLIKVLEKDDDLHVRAAAAEALGGIGSAKALSHLYASMSKDHTFVRRHAERAIRKIEARGIE